MAIDFGGCKSGAHRPAALVCGLFLPRLTRSSPSLSPPTSWKRCRRRLHGRRIVAAAVRRKRGASRSAKETTLRKKRERREKFGAKFWRRFWPAVFCDVFLRRCSSGGSHPRVLLSAVRLCAVCACRCGDGPRLGGRPGGAMAFAPFFSHTLSLLVAFGFSGRRRGPMRSCRCASTRSSRRRSRTSTLSSTSRRSTR